MDFRRNAELLGAETKCRRQPPPPRLRQRLRLLPRSLCLVLSLDEWDPIQEAQYLIREAGAGIPEAQAGILEAPVQDQEAPVQDQEAPVQ
jgi:hypothetical protein